MPTLDDYRWLVSADAAGTLADAAALLVRDGLLATAKRLRKMLPASVSQLVLAQCELRLRAREKFALAERMFFTNISLQQATGEAVAQHKGARFPAHAVVYDLCCGIGGDLLSLAARGPAMGVERDEIVSLLAAANCQAAGVKQGEVRCADATALQFDEQSLVHIDPDRRPGGRRSTRLELHEPSESFLEERLTRCAGGAIKLAPACELPQSWQTQCELEWISHQGECKQLVAWFGTLAQRPGARAATTLHASGVAAQLAARREESALAATADSIGRFIYEPDAAVIAARLTDALAERQRLARLSPDVAYLTGDALVDDASLTAFEVLEVLPLDLKRVKAALHARKLGRIEVKKRGVDVSPEELRRKLKVEGDQAATLIVAPHQGATTAIIARRAEVSRARSPGQWQAGGSALLSKQVAPASLSGYHAKTDCDTLGAK